MSRVRTIPQYDGRGMELMRGGRIEEGHTVQSKMPGVRISSTQAYGFLCNAYAGVVGVLHFFASIAALASPDRRQ